MARKARPRQSHARARSSFRPPGPDELLVEEVGLSVRRRSKQEEKSRERRQLFLLPTVPWLASTFLHKESSTASPPPSKSQMLDLDDLDMGEPACVGRTRTKWKVFLSTVVDFFILAPAVFKTTQFWINHGFVSIQWTACWQTDSKSNHSSYVFLHISFSFQRYIQVFL